MQTDHFLTSSLQDRRIARTMHSAIQGVDPAALVAGGLKHLKLPAHRRRFLLGLGKAAESMTMTAAESLGGFEAALIITKHQTIPSGPRLRVLEAGHPVPDRRSIVAGQAALEFVSGLSEADVLVGLISGGGSALAIALPAGISLEDMQRMASIALASGANIEDVNILRRQTDRIKGGGLAAATKASVVSLILSDVIGDRLEAIASGPTAPNPTGPADALMIVEKFNLDLPEPIMTALGTPRPTLTGQALGRVHNVVVGNCSVAAASACRQAESEGFAVELLDSQLQGEARDIGRDLAARLRVASATRNRPFCLVAAGETTVTLNGHGIGGRNQELALAAVDGLEGLENVLLISLATDGEDGPTDAAGAVVTGTSKRRALELGMPASGYLARHDSYPFFNALGDLLKPGYTGTNVNDLMLLVGL